MNEKCDLLAVCGQGIVFYLKIFMSYPSDGIKQLQKQLVFCYGSKFENRFRSLTFKKMLHSSSFFIFKAELGSLQGYFLVSANKERKYYYSSFSIYIWGERRDFHFIVFWWELKNGFVGLCLLSIEQKQTKVPAPVAAAKTNFYFHFFFISTSLVLGLFRLIFFINQQFSSIIYDFTT